MFATISGYGVDVARQRIDELHRDAERYRLARRARRRRAQRRRVLRGWLRPAPARTAAAR
jgi:hypothetical protein